MRRKVFLSLGMIALVLCSRAGAQLGGLGASLPGLGNTLPAVLDRPLAAGDDLLRGTVQEVAEHLSALREQRIDKLVRNNRDAIERDAAGDPAVRGEVLLVDPAPGALDAAGKVGFLTLGSERMDDLGIDAVRLAVPKGMTLAEAQRRLSALLPQATVVADTLHFTSGGVGAGAGARASPAPASGISETVGMIDGGATGPLALQAGFARGAPAPSDHGAAVASLLRRAGVSRIAAADVYGSDPAGGNALAIARALDWMAARRVRVVSISLVGPQNALVARAVSAAQGRGMQIFAAVGNDGPAAPPAYPASYPGVFAITGVDARHRPLIEAGHALHLDYAAPGADLRASNARGKAVPVRGTSFAAPLAAARAAALLGRGTASRDLAAALDREALRPARAAQIGRGILCSRCR
jgi:hypothetical protein